MSAQTCPQCGQGFESLAGLVSHMKMPHEHPETERTFVLTDEQADAQYDGRDA